MLEPVVSTEKYPLVNEVELCDDQKRESPSRQTLSHTAHMSADEGII